VKNPSTPLVCICVPTYNAGKTLSATLDSILGQTYSNLLVKVVDNASTDNTLQIADVYASKDLRVSVIRNGDNIGAEGNFTRCLQLAEGDYTAIFHSDDIYSPEIVKEQVAFLEKHPQAGAVFTMAQSIDEEGKPGRTYTLPSELIHAESTLYEFPEIFRVMLKYGNFIFCPSAMAKTSVYRDCIKIWDSGNFGNSADLDVWLRILKLHPVGILPEPLLFYRGAAMSSYSYTAVRTKTDPHNMLRVFETYMAEYARDLMGPKEKADYARLVMNDNVNRAFNFAAMSKPAEAKALLAGVFRPGSLSTAFCSVYHLKTVVLAFLTILLILLPLPGRIRRQVSIWRFKSRG